MLNSRILAGGIGWQQRRQRSKKNAQEDDEDCLTTVGACVCAETCVKTEFVQWESAPLFKGERGVFTKPSELGKVKAVIQGLSNHEIMDEGIISDTRDEGIYSRKWRNHARAFLSHLWPKRTEGLAIGNHSCAINAPSTRGRVVNYLTMKTCETSVGQ